MACLCASNQAVLYVMPSWASSWTVATVAERAQSLQRTAPWWRAKVQCNDRRRFTEGVQARNLLFGISFCSAQLASPAMVRLLLDHSRSASLGHGGQVAGGLRRARRRRPVDFDPRSSQVARVDHSREKNPSPSSAESCANQAVRAQAVIPPYVFLRRILPWFR